MEQYGTIWTQIRITVSIPETSWQVNLTFINTHCLVGLVVNVATENDSLGSTQRSGKQSVSQKKTSSLRIEPEQAAAEKPKCHWVFQP